jgi:hypothetical protein
VVGANGFEPSTSWSRNKRASVHKALRFSNCSENQALNARGRMCAAVSGCVLLFVGSLQKPLHSLANFLTVCLYE